MKNHVHSVILIKEMIWFCSLAKGDTAEGESEQKLWQN